jgi:hypothetical protein
MSIPLGILAAAGEALKSDLVSSQTMSGNLSSFTTGALSLGKANAKRVIVVAVSTGSTTASPISNVQLDGVNMTLAAKASGSGSNRLVGVFYMSKPTGASAVFRVVLPNNAQGCMVNVYAVYTNTVAPLSADSGSTTATVATCSGLTAAAKGFAVAVSHHNNTNLTTWGGTLGIPLVADFNGTLGGDNASIASCVTPSAATGTVTASWAGANNGSASIGIWGP